jgi:hypothetical protein
MDLKFFIPWIPCNPWLKTNHSMHRVHGVGESGDGLGKMHLLFGDQMDTLIDELNR